eukprot:613906-Pelagomonas_calceolata.AAC.1
MDRAPVYGTGGSRFDPWFGHVLTRDHTFFCCTMADWERPCAALKLLQALSRLPVLGTCEIWERFHGVESKDQKHCEIVCSNKGCFQFFQWRLDNFPSCLFAIMSTTVKEGLADTKTTWSSVYYI